MDRDRLLLVRTPRPTGQPPRCRWCGAICHPAPPPWGGAFDPVCAACTADRTAADDRGERIPPIPLLRWAGAAGPLAPVDC